MLTNATAHALNSGAVCLWVAEMGKLGECSIEKVSDGFLAESRCKLMLRSPEKNGFSRDATRIVRFLCGSFAQQLLKGWL